VDFQIEWKEQLSSTNSAMREQLEAQPSSTDGWILAAHRQTAGRGRLDRTWHTPPRSGLCFSLFLKTEAPIAQIPSSTMAAALAVDDLLHTLQIPSTPKWPNDILVENQKICGILSERVEKRGVIIGIGLNVNLSPAEAAMIDRPATSIFMQTGLLHEPPNILTALLPHLDHWLEQWKSSGFPAIQDEWTRRAGPIGKTLCVHDGTEKIEGKLAGFGSFGELLLDTGHSTKTIWSGEIPLPHPKSILP
jgi:BirA family biotin operon repressor/biotin-[acetyl-CoA-carboxylase] ligase